MAPRSKTFWTLSYPDHGNTGALTAYMPTCDIDILDQKAADACEQLVRNRFGDTGSLLVRIGRPPKRAVVFQTAKPFDKIAVSLVAPNGDAKQKIELLCKGQQVVVDGVHPDTHKPYTWFGGVLGDVKRGDLLHLNEAEAKMLVRDLAELLIAEHGYTLAPARPKTETNGHDSEYQPFTGDRSDDWGYLLGNILDGAELHDSVRDLAAKLIVAGVKNGAAVNFIRGILSKSPAPHDDRYYDRLHDIPRLVSSARQKFADSEYVTEEQVWPDPKPIPRGLPSVDAFNLDFLPNALKPWVGDVSERLQCPPDYVAVAAIVALGSVIGRRIGIKPQTKTDWVEVPNIWGGFIGRPGMLKSPAMQEALKPLHRREVEAVKNNEIAREAYAAGMSEYKLRQSVNIALKKEQLKKAGGQKIDISFDCGEEPKEPKAVRFRTNDSSYEALGELLRADPKTS